MSKRRVIVGVVACLIATGFEGAGPFNTSVFALAEQALAGTVIGTITDAEGARLPGATVSLTNASNGLRREAVTTANGTYSILNVQPGTYEIRISSGTATFERRGVVIRAGDIARVDSQLRTTGVGPAPQVADNRQVHVGLYTFVGDGRPSGSAAIGGADDFAGYVSADAGLCSVQAGREPEGTGTFPAVSWRISGRVLRRTSDAIMIRIEWQRVWENGERQSKPRNGTLDATIRVGERFPLDSVTSAGGACSVTGGSLEATVMARPARTGGAGFGGRGGRGSGRGGAATSPRPAGEDVGAGSIEAQKSGDTSEGGVAADRLAAAAQELRQRAALQQARAGSAPVAFQAELWLVHKRPDTTEHVQLITLPFAVSTSFVFPPVRVMSEKLPVDVEVFGSLRHMQGDADAKALTIQIAIARNLRQSGVRPTENYSASGKVVPWPAPADVLSFELPVSPADQRILAGHRFDLRLRITPR